MTTKTNAAQSQKPNVLLIVINQLRRDSLGCYGDPVTQTPTFDALAAAGTRYTNCISNHPVCSPWRASLQTGHYAWKHGVQINNQRIDTSLTSLADLYNARGYHTAYLGKAHWWDSGKPGFYPDEPRLRWQQWWGLNRGHFHWDAPDFDDDGTETHRFAGRYEPEVQTDKALKIITEQSNHPWLIQLNWGPPHNASMDREYNDPSNRQRMQAVNDHRAWNIPPEVMEHIAPDDAAPVKEFLQSLTGRLLPEAYLGMYPEHIFPDRPDIPAEHADRLRAIRREYSAMVTSLDDQMQRLLSHLDVTGQRGNTIIIVTADHGDHLGNLGHARGKATHLQSAWRVPLIMCGPGIGQGCVNNDLVAGIDLFPTLGGLIDADVPANVAGIDIRHDQRQHVLVGLRDWRCLVTHEWAYAMQRESDQTWTSLSLTDLKRDPWDLYQCHRNQPDICVDLQERLLTEMQAADDPFVSIDV
jgi:arylsulfatase A-like enzyme